MGDKTSASLRAVGDILKLRETPRQNDSKKKVNHKDGNKINNNVDNLE